MLIITIYGLLCFVMGAVCGWLGHREVQRAADSTCRHGFDYDYCPDCCH